MTYGDKPYGLRDVKLTNIAGSSQVDLPASQKFSFSEQLSSNELRGDDVIKAVVTFGDAVEWELEAGGISLEAYALMTGRTVMTSGLTPNETKTMAGSAGDTFPYIKVYGKSLGEGDDDVHCKLFKCKVTELEGEFGDGGFFVTKCSGIGVDDGTNGIFEFVQNETAADLPST